MYIDMFTDFKNELVSTQEALKQCKQNQPSVKITYQDDTIQTVKLSEPTPTQNMNNVKSIEFNFNLEDISRWMSVMDM
jgi:hypothetical protein